MKKLSVVILALVMIFSCIAMTACGDALEEKVAEMNVTYNEFGTAFYNAVKCCTFNNVYTSDELTPKFSAWAALLKEAKSEKKNYLDYDEAGLDRLISKWKTAIEELNTVAAKYPIPTGIEDETVSVETT